MPRTNWAGNVTLGAARYRPASVDNLRQIVGNSRRIRALGRGHSFNGIVGVAGDLVLLDGLPKMLDIDSARSTVKVAAGMVTQRWPRELHRTGFALANMASIPHISIGGACATRNPRVWRPSMRSGRLGRRNAARRFGWRPNRFAS